MANKFFWEYGATDNSEDEDLQSQLYAEIYYAPGERNAGDGEGGDPVEGKEEAERKSQQSGKPEKKAQGLTDSCSRARVPKQSGCEGSQSKLGWSQAASEDAKPVIVPVDAEPVDEKPVVKGECRAVESVSEERDEKDEALRELCGKDVKLPQDSEAQGSLAKDQSGSSFHETASVSEGKSVKSEVEAYDEAEAVETKNVELITNTANVDQATDTASVRIKADCNAVKQECTENETDEATVVDDTRTEEEPMSILKKYEFSKKFINELYEKKFEELNQVLQEEEERQRLERLNQQNAGPNENEVDTRYAIMQKHQKKKQTSSQDGNTGQTEESGNESDSEESILEVPIPPKPQPPVINLQDSDEDVIISSDSDTGIECISLSKRSSKGRKERAAAVRNVQTRLHGEEQASGSLKIEDSDSEYDSSSDTSSDSIDNIEITNMEEDIMLHCTEAQRGASSLKEIKEKSKETINKLMNAGRVEVNKALGDKDVPSKEKASPKQSLKAAALSKASGSPKSDKNVEKADGKNVPANSEDGAQLNKRKQCGDTDEGPSTSKRARCNNNSEQGENDENNVQDADDKKKRKREETWEEYIFRPMSEKLKAFYGESRGQENYDIAEIQRNMSKDPNMWAILDEDLRPSCNKKQRFWNVRCSNCHREGHQRYNCDEPRKPAQCHMCGVQGHTEMRCPQKICLTCGKKQGSFRKTCESCRILYCHMCDSVGHKPTECPDLWRRFHQTTRTTNINIPENLNEVMKPADLLVCCNCAKRGHDSSTCNEYRWSQHFPTPSYVSNYTDGPGYAATPQSSQSSHSQQPPKSLPPVEPQQPAAASQSPQSSKMPKSSQQEDVIPVASNKNQASPIGDDYKTIFKCGRYIGKKSGVRFAKRLFQVCIVSTGFLQGKVKPYFITDLMNHLRMGFEMTVHYRSDNRILLDVNSYAKSFGKLVYQLMYHWIQLQDDEKTHAMTVQLPKCKDEMIELLRAKMPELKGKHDAAELWPRVKMLKEQMLLNKDPAQRVEIMKELMESQSKLVKAVQTKPRVANGLERMKHFIELLSNSKSQKVDTYTFMSILILYNKLFTCYTPPEVSLTAKQRADRHKAKRETKNRNQEDVASVAINTQQSSLNQGGPCAENTGNNYRKEPALTPQNNEARNCDKMIMIPNNNITGLTISVPNNLCVQSPIPSLMNAPPYHHFDRRHHEIVDFTSDDCVAVTPSGNIDNAVVERAETSSNPNPTIAFNHNAEAVKTGEQCASKNNKKNKAKKAKKAKKSLINKFAQFGKRKANVQQGNLMQRAHKLLANAVAFEIPYMTKEAAEFAKRMTNNTLKQKHVDVLQRLVNLENSRQKRVDSVPKFLG